MFDPSTFVPAGINATDGHQTAYSNGGTISQVLSTTLANNTLYNLLVDVADRSDTAFPGYAVRLYAGANLLAQESSLVPNNGWLTSSISFNSGVSGFAGQALRLELFSAGVQTNFDNVRFSDNTRSEGVTAVPEPLSLILLGSGLLGIATVRRRSRSSRSSFA